MTIAIYSRKSKFTGTGDSVENQIQMCKDHLNYIYRDKFFETKVYEDEGYTGKNTNRPMFKQMLLDIKQNKISVVICYRLDRLSRSVADFSQLLSLLTQFNVEFISVSENFDTSTPMGRAMISIASVFAQLERETIAERVKDNKVLIAKGGRWQGGTPPLGYKAVKSTSVDAENKNRTCYYLMEDESSKELDTAKLMFDLFSTHKSINKVEIHLLKNKILTAKGKEYTGTVIKQILTNPIYTTNHPAVFDYLSKSDCVIVNAREEFTGNIGIIGYGKTACHANMRKRSTLDNWVVAFGKHKGIIDGEQWVKIQNILQKNSLKFPRMQTSEVALFSGMIRCSCGAAMLVTGNRPDKSGKPSYYYKCYRKDRSHGELCDIKNIKGVDFDNEVMEYIKTIVKNDSSILEDVKISIKKIAQIKTDTQNSIKKSQALIVEKEKSIEQLVLRLTDTNLSKNVLDYVNNTISTISSEIDELKTQLLELNKRIALSSSDKDNLLLINQRISELVSLPADVTVKDKREIIKNIIDHITWDGFNFKIILYTDKITGGWTPELCNFETHRYTGDYGD